jgi:hypothetical protein
MVQHRLCGGQCARSAFAGSGPAARHQGRARVKRILPQLRRKFELRRVIGSQQLPQRAALQFIQHIAQTVGHFVAIDQAAPEKFLSTCILGVVEDFLENISAAGRDKVSCD